jgi:alpha/beta superfamily hydrolase
MKTSLHKIYTEDGLELSGILYQPEQETRTIVAHVPGMAGYFYSHRYLDVMAKTFTKNNIAFCPFNNRGSGYITYLFQKTNNANFKILSQVSCPIFTAMGRKDDVLVIPIEDIMGIIKEKAKSSPRCEHKILGDATHDYRGYEEELTNTVLNWIKNLQS